MKKQQKSGPVTNTLHGAANRVLDLADEYAHVLNLEGVRDLTGALLLEALTGDGEAGMLAASLMDEFDMSLALPKFHAE